MRKRTKIIILSFMIVLLGVTAYLNVILNNQVTKTSTNNIQTTSSYFTTYRTDRETSRDQAILYYDAIIESSASTSDAIATAQEAKLDLISQMETELVVESLIKAKGFSDCVITMNGKNVNVVVQAKELTSTEVAQIVSIVQQQLKTNIKNIKIIPVE